MKRVSTVERSHGWEPEFNSHEGSYSYEEAINLAGNGWYNRGLLAVLSMALLGMGIDIFGFSVIVTGCTCDFQLEHYQKNILLSMSFVGPILTSYLWGYLSDTHGRRASLLIGLWVSFLASTLSAFSANWIMLAVLKAFSTSFCSSAQSCTYTLLGESCNQRVRDFYMLLMTSVLMLFLLSYVVPGYYILNMNFSIDIGLMNFTPWRLLTIVMALPLGISAIGLQLCIESPKFFISVGRQDDAVNSLQAIYMKNGGIKNKYPVRNVYISQETSRKGEGKPLLQSLKDQTFPLFKPPLLRRTVQLFFLTSVIYSINNSLVMWMPSIVQAFAYGMDSAGAGSMSLCEIIISTQYHNTPVDSLTCTSSLEERTLFSGIFHGLLFSGITVCVSKFAAHKKALLIAFLAIPLVSSAAAVLNQDEYASLVLFVGMMMTNLCMGVLFSYYVELYPTSHRGMAACLGVMVARLSGLAGVNFIGSYVMTHCAATFYAFSAYLFCGIVVAYFLPAPVAKTDAECTNEA